MATIGDTRTLFNNDLEKVPDTLAPFGYATVPALPIECKYPNELTSYDPALTIEDLLSRAVRAVCDVHRVDISRLSMIQRKFITHYRCAQCGLVPLFYINVLHLKRVRCKKCGQLVPFKRKGKYGKLRKDIAIEFARSNHGVYSFV